MAGMLEYKCPCCDGAIQFDSATQKMKCPYCDTEFDVDTLKGYDEELKDEKPSEMEWAPPGGSWAEGETAGLHTYSCKSCGGEIVGDDTMAASACPFCGNPIVLTGQFAGTLRPDLIIPFKLDRKAAKAKLQEHLKGKTLLPRVFRSQNHIDEIKSVHVPFWLFDTVTAESSSVQLHGGKAKYALYPVWILNTTWKGQKYTFAMNGQTGKFVGDLPVDKAAARRWKLILTAAFSAAVYAAAWLLWFLDIL